MSRTDLRIPQPTPDNVTGFNHYGWLIIVGNEAVMIIELVQLQYLYGRDGGGFFSLLSRGWVGDENV
jgi:hypothetical protein